MINSLDTFALSFDSIRVDAKTPIAAAAESVRSAPVEGPGFYLLDDAGGRFTIDHDVGVVSLVHDHVLELEPGAVHGVRIRVIEPSGAAYEYPLKLRVTGRVPQVVGADADAALAALTAAPLQDLLTPPRPAPETAAAPARGSPPAPSRQWAHFAAAMQAPGGLERLGPEHAAFGALIAFAPAAKAPAYAAELSLTHEAPPPSSAAAHWLI